MATSAWPSISSRPLARVFHGSTVQSDGAWCDGYGLMALFSCECLGKRLIENFPVGTGEGYHLCENDKYLACIHFTNTRVTSDAIATNNYWINNVMNGCMSRWIENVIFRRFRCQIAAIRRPRLCRKHSRIDACLPLFSSLLWRHRRMPRTDDHRRSSSTFGIG